MKKILHLVSILVISLYANAQSAYRIQYETTDKYLNSLLQHEDSVAYVYASSNDDDFEYVKLSWNIPSQSYLSNIKYVYSFNQQGSLLETEYYKWDDNAWAPQSKTSRTYSGQNILTQISLFNWSANAWTETQRTTITNNIQGKKTEMLEQNTSGGQLVNYRKYVYKYDNSLRLIKDSTFNWNTSNSSWRLEGMVEHFYSTGSTFVDSNKRYVVISPNNNIELLYKTYYKYNTLGNEIERLEFYDYLGTYTPLPYRHYTNLYDSKGNTIESGYREITNGQWVDQRRTLSQYNTQNQLTERTFLQYKSSVGYVTNNSRSVYAYAPDSSLIVVESYTWVDDNWLPSRQDRIGYRSLQQQTDVDKLSTSTAKAYPNPFTTNTIIAFESAKTAQANIRIYDFNGRLVFDDMRYVINGTNTLLWEAKDHHGNTLPAGLYILKIKTENQLLTMKLIKQ